MDITSSPKWKELTSKIKFIDETTYQRTLELFYAEFGMKMLEDDALRCFITTYQNKKIGLYYTKVWKDFCQLGADVANANKRRSRSKLENKLVDEIGTVEDIESYKEALELYYNVFGDDMFEIEKVQRFIDAFELDNINITPNTVYRDLRSIKSAFWSRDEISQSNFTSLHPDIKPAETIAQPIQTQRNQTQNNFNIANGKNDNLKNLLVREWKSDRGNLEEDVDIQQLPPLLTDKFYISSYRCPICGRHMYKTVFPIGGEFPIRTANGYISMKRIFTCETCKKFFTPLPGRKLSCGQYYSLKIDTYDEYELLLATFDEHGSTVGRPDA